MRHDITMRHHILPKFASLTFVTLLSVVIAESAANAAFGDCISWMWGGKNQETSYSTASTHSSAMPDKDDGKPLGELRPAPYGVTNPVYCPPVQQVSVAKVDSIPYQQANTTTTVLKPVVSKEWSYSRINSVEYKPVQTFDHRTGVVSAEYRKEESKSLLPWLHRKEVVRYEPQTIQTPSVSYNQTPPPSVVRSNYGPVVYPCVDTYVNVVNPNGIPSESVGYSGSYPSGAAMSSSVYVSQNVGGSQPTGPIPTYGTPDLLFETGSRGSNPQRTDMRSEADYIPVLPRSSSYETKRIISGVESNIQLAGAGRTADTYRKPIASFSATDIEPIDAISPDELEEMSREKAAKIENKTEQSPLKPVPSKSGTLVRTPAPVFDSEPQSSGSRLSISPTRTKLQYKPAGM